MESNIGASSMSWKIFTVPPSHFHKQCVHERLTWSTLSGNTVYKYGQHLLAKGSPSTCGNVKIFPSSMQKPSLIKALKSFLNLEVENSHNQCSRVCHNSSLSRGTSLSPNSSQRRGRDSCFWKEQSLWQAASPPKSYLHIHVDLAHMPQQK